MKIISYDTLQDDSKYFYFECKVGDGGMYDWINLANQYEAFYESEDSKNILDLLVTNFMFSTRKWVYAEPHEIIPPENYERPYLKFILETLKRYNQENKFEIVDIDLSKSYHVDYKTKGELGKYYKSLPLMIGETNSLLSKLSYDFIKSKKNIEKKFMCLMARSRWERAQIFSFLYEEGIEKDSYISHHTSPDEMYKPNRVLLPKDVDIPFNEDKAFSKNTWNYNQRMGISSVYVKSFCNIICESKWDNKHIQISEKTDKAITTLQPFIIVGNYNSLKALKSYGFKTFDRWWDESYDDVENNDERMDAIKKTIKYINDNVSIDEYKSMEDILKHNFDLSQSLFKKEHYKYYTNPIPEQIVIDKKTNEISLRKFFAKNLDI